MFRTQKRIEAGEALEGRRAAFTFTCSPWDLTVNEAGEVLPVIGRISHEKGLDGCRSTGPLPDDVDEDGAILNALKNPGRRVIPHDFKVRAFGHERAGYIGNEDGKPMKATEGEWWNDAWTRITWEAGRPTTTIDPDGWLDFHRRVLAWMCPDGLTPSMISAAEKSAGMPAGPGGKPRPAKGRKE